MDSDKEIVLAGKKVVERPDRHFGAIDHVLHGEFNAAALLHEFYGGCYEPVGALLGPGPGTLQRTLNAQPLPLGHAGFIDIDINIDIFGRLDRLAIRHVSCTLRMIQARISASSDTSLADIWFFQCTAA